MNTLTISPLDSLVKYIDDSLKAVPMLELDPSYLQIRANISDIVTNAIEELGYTIDYFPQNIKSGVILLARKEIFLRLATSVAPEYSVETQFTKILKNTRFDHYFKLVTQTQEAIDKLKESGMFYSVTAGEMILSKRVNSFRNYALAKPQIINLTLSNITSNSVCLDWNQFNLTAGNFAGYTILYDTIPVYDEYLSPSVIISSTTLVLNIDDIRRTKCRLINLLPNTNYHIALLYKTSNGKVDAVSSDFSTLPIS